MTRDRADQKVPQLFSLSPGLGTEPRASLVLEVWFHSTIAPEDATSQGDSEEDGSGTDSLGASATVGQGTSTARNIMRTETRGHRLPIQACL